MSISITFYQRIILILNSMENIDVSYAKADLKLIKSLSLVPNSVYFNVIAKCR